MRYITKLFPEFVQEAWSPGMSAGPSHFKPSLALAFYISLPTPSALHSPHIIQFPSLHLREQTCCWTLLLAAGQLTPRHCWYIICTAFLPSLQSPFETVQGLLGFCAHLHKTCLIQCPQSSLQGLLHRLSGRYLTPMCVVFRLYLPIVLQFFSLQLC